jgi:dextranase
MHNKESNFSIYPLYPRIKPGAATIPMRLEAELNYLPHSVELGLYNLGTCLEKKSIVIPKRSYRYDFMFNIDKNSMQEGMGLGIRAVYEGYMCETAIDVGEGPVRYGFVSNFSAVGGIRIIDVIRFLLQNHITHVQFYDWNYRPDQYVPEQSDEDEYVDTMGKVISQNMLRILIKEIQYSGIRALGYGAVYAARKQYLVAHPKQGLYDINGKPFDLIDTFFIMNLDNSSWRDHLLKQYVYAVEQVGFDGIHMDTYGYPKSGWGYASDDDSQMKYYDLRDQFVSVINGWAEHGDVNIFNNVGGWPAEATAKVHQEACYIEVWPPHTRYHHLRTLIQNVKSKGKPVILAAYLEPFKKRDEAGLPTKKPLEAAKLLTSITSSLGATTLLYGEDGGVLTQPYYSDYSRLTEDECMMIQQYSDHQVRFRELLFDPEAEDITESHGLGENREFSFIPNDPSIPITHDGEPGSVMVVITRSPKHVVINLINLIDQGDDLWNSDKEPCGTKPDITIQLPKYGNNMKIYSCSADARPSQIRNLPIEDVEGVRGLSVECTIQSISTWTTIWCELR